MSFISELNAWPPSRVEQLIASATPGAVTHAIASRERSLPALAALLSPAARPYIESMAVEAQRATRRFFGRTIGLYAPIYLSNVCGADCAYCGYAVRSGNKEKRRTLDEPEIRLECETLAARGFQHVLLLTGEARRAVPVSYIARAIALAREYFSSVSVEVYALEREGYDILVQAGLDGVTLYMETYHRDTYSEVHLIGEKCDYDNRLEAIERAGAAGARRLNVGVLLGLYNWRIDCFWLALHAKYLQRACWQSAISLSFPRLLHVPERFDVPEMVDDASLAQAMLALRLYLPETGFNLSTREPASLRDRFLPLGVTMMSAGSSTRPGGYASYGQETLEQFEIEDERSPADVAEAIRRAGYDPVWKDFDRAFDAPLPAR